MYGEVTYNRVVYEVTQEDGTRCFVYLLDETLELENVGLVPTNMKELLVKKEITELSYWECASKVSEMTGETISAMGVWNVIQAEKVCEEKKTLVKSYKEGHVQSMEKKRCLCCLRKRMASISACVGKNGNRADRTRPR